MNKRFSLGTVLALMLLVASVTYLISIELSIRNLNSKLSWVKEQEDEVQKIFEVKQYIEKSFVGQYEEEKLLDGALAGMVGSLGDRWSYYLNAEDFKAVTEEDNKFVGIGVSVTPLETGYLRINEVYSGSPAEEVGIRPLDVITAVENEDISEIGYDSTLERIRGDEYTTVKITLDRRGELYTVDVKRRMVTIQMVNSELLEEHIGYIRVRAFENHVDADFAEAILRLQSINADSLIIDLRNNPGGLLNVLLPMLDSLLPEGVLMTTRSNEGSEVVYESDERHLGLPVVVLINGNSYSAAEFFAACLQEHEWATIVGEPTMGKGYAQERIQLSDGSGLILSTMEYFTPSGSSLAGVGIKPDVEIILTEDEYEMLFSSDHAGDRQLEMAIQILGTVRN